MVYDGEQISALDLVGSGSLTLLVSEKFDALGPTLKIGKVPIKVVRLRTNFQVSDEEWLDLLGFTKNRSVLFWCVRIIILLV